MALAYYIPQVRAELSTTYPTLAASLERLSEEMAHILAREVLRDPDEIRATAQMLRRILVCVCTEYVVEQGHSRDLSVEITLASRYILGIF
jgi:hypothetical protein